MNVSAKTATKVLSKRKWRQFLKNRKYLVMFQLPSEISRNCNAKNMTKRMVSISLSTGSRMKGVATISSGTELYIPTHLRHYFKDANWFDCEIINDTLYEKSTIDVY
jgi:hypothetical protein